MFDLLGIYQELILRSKYRIFLNLNILTFKFVSTNLSHTFNGLFKISFQFVVGAIDYDI